MDPTVLSALLANATPPAPALPPEIEAYIATLPVQFQDAARAHYLGPQPVPVAPQPAVIPYAAPAPVEQPAPAQPDAEAELARLLASNTSNAKAAVDAALPAPAPAPAKAPRGRPAGTGNKFALLCACASGGLTLEQARAYMTEAGIQ